jgi:single-strand DNA-binding protein
MAGINRATLLGNVGESPEIRQLDNGREMARFSLATSEKWKNKETGEVTQRTEWHRIAVFSPGLVKVIKQYVVKGSKLLLEGKISTSKYQDKEGNDKYATDIVLQGYDAKMVMLNGKGSEQKKEKTFSTDQYAYASGGSVAKQPPQPEDIEDDEIPFF